MKTVPLVSEALEWNLVSGCAGTFDVCRHCLSKGDHNQRYAMWQHLTRLGGTPMMADATPLSAQYSLPFRQPILHGDRLLEPLTNTVPSTYLVTPHSDLFQPSVPDGFIQMVFGQMAACRRHRFYLVTRYHARASALLTRGIVTASVNIALGFALSGAQEKNALDLLREIETVGIRFVVLQPLQNAPEGLDFTGMDWIVVGTDEQAPFEQYGSLPHTWLDLIIHAAAADSIPLHIAQNYEHDDFVQNPLILSDGVIRRYIDYPVWLNCGVCAFQYPCWSTRYCPSTATRDWLMTCWYCRDACCGMCVYPVPWIFGGTERHLCRTCGERFAGGRRP